MPLRTVAPESPAVLASLFSPTAPPMAQPSTPESVPSPSGETVAVPEDNPAEEPTEMVPAEFPALPTFVESTPVAAGRHEVPAPLSRDSVDAETAPIEPAGEGQSARRKTPRAPIAPETAAVMAAPKATPDVANATIVVERAPVHVDGAPPRAPGVAKTNAATNPVVAATVATAPATIAPVATAPTAADDVVEQPSQTVPPAATVKVERGVQRRPVETGETAMPVKLPATPLPAPVETVRISAPAAPAAPVVETGSGPNHPIERGEVSVGARQSAVVAETAPSITSTPRAEPATSRPAEFALPAEGAAPIPGRRPEVVHGREPARPALPPVAPLSR